MLGIASVAGMAATLPGQETGVRLEPVPELGRGESGRVRANLASENIGTTVTSQNGSDGLENGLDNAVSDDGSARLALPRGISVVPLELADLYDVNRIFFRSFSARGTVRVLGSNRPLEIGSPDWQEIVPPVNFGGEAFVDEDFADLTLQYLVFEFDISVPGKLSPLGVMGEEFISQSSANPPTSEELESIPESEKASLVPYDFASLVNGTTVALISSGPVANAHSMIDDDITTFYEFEADDPGATLLLDLRANYHVTRIGLTLEAQPGQLDIYTFNVLPQSLRAPEDGGEESQSVVVEAGFFESVFPVASRTFPESIDSAELDFDDIDAQYALIRWTPSPGAEGSGANPPLRIYEISFIGMVPDDMAAFPLIPQTEFAGINPPTVPIPDPEPIPVEIPDPVSPR